MNRRGFLGACFLAAAAPAIVRADSLMRIIPRTTSLLTFSGAGGGFGRILYGALLTPDGNVIAAFDMQPPTITDGVATFAAVEAQAKRAGFASNLRITDEHGIELAHCPLTHSMVVNVGETTRVAAKVTCS